MSDDTIVFLFKNAKAFYLLFYPEEIEIKLGYGGRKGERKKDVMNKMENKMSHP